MTRDEARELIKINKVMDEKRMETGQALLNAALDFWNACHEERQYGAVQWLTGTHGELVIFTRGEYRNTLMANIARVQDEHKVHVFGESLPILDEEE